MGANDDDAWRAIVDNYGERAEVEPEEPGYRLYSVDPSPEVRSWDDDFVDSDWTTDRFVPPPPPPLPTTTTDRYAAWAAMMGSPVVLLICLVLGVGLPQPLPYLLVAGFVGGFLYLVVTMSREPRDPGDDGARL